MYEIVRRFYAYICQEKDLEQASINLVCSKMTSLEQEIMDALAFDGAMIKEGKEVACDGRIYSKDSIEFWMDDQSISIMDLMKVDFHHGSNAKVEKV